MGEAIALALAWAAREGAAWYYRRRARAMLTEAFRELGVEAGRLEMKLAELEARRKARSSK